MKPAIERAANTENRIRILQGDVDRSATERVHQRDLDTGDPQYDIPVTTADIRARIDSEIQLLHLQRSSALRQA